MGEVREVREVRGRMAGKKGGGSGGGKSRGSSSSSSSKQAQGSIVPASSAQGGDSITAEGSSLAVSSAAAGGAAAAAPPRGFLARVVDGMPEFAERAGYVARRITASTGSAAWCVMRATPPRALAQNARPAIGRD